jgi:hypothetical protein
VLPAISAFMSRGVPEGEPVVLDVAQLEALLSRTFGIGLDVGRCGGPPRPSAAAAVERGIPAAQMAAAEGLALHAAAFNGMPDPVFHLAGRATSIVTGLAAIEPDPRVPGRDVILDAALQAATGQQQLLSFRRACTTATSPAEQQRATGTLLSAAAELGKAAEAACGLIELARLTAASGRTGTTDLN